MQQKEGLGDDSSNCYSAMFPLLSCTPGQSMFNYSMQSLTASRGKAENLPPELY